MGAHARRSSSPLTPAVTFTGLLVGALALMLVAGAGMSSGADGCVVSVTATGPASGADLQEALDDAATAVTSATCTDWTVEVSGTFTLTEELVWDVAVPLRIVGPEGGTARIEASGAGFRLLTVDLMAGGEPVTLERLVLAGGDVSAVSTPGDDEGGAVAADVLVLIDVEMNGNKARNGGAVVTGDLTAIRTSFIGNIGELGSPSAGTGLGGAVLATGDVVLANVSFLGNIAASGGALHHDTLGFGPDGSLTATFVTLLDNEASAAGEGAHLQLEGSLSPLTLRGVLVGRTGGSAARPACGGGAFGIGSVTWTDSFAFDATCTGIDPATADEDDGVSAAIATLTDTSVAFLPGTTDLLVPAGDWAGLDGVACGGTTGLPGTDQRGVTRPQPADGRCDAGAVERTVVVTEPPEDPVQDPVQEPEEDPASRAELVVAGPVPTAIPAGDGGCADGGCADGCCADGGDGVSAARRAVPAPPR